MCEPVLSNTREATILYLLISVSLFTRVRRGKGSCDVSGDGVCAGLDDGGKLRGNSECLDETGGSSGGFRECRCV